MTLSGGGANVSERGQQELDCVVYSTFVVCYDSNTFSRYEGSDEEHTTCSGGTITFQVSDSAVSPRACREAGGADTS